MAVLNNLNRSCEGTPNERRYDKSSQSTRPQVQFARLFSSHRSIISTLRPCCPSRDLIPTRPTECHATFGRRANATHADLIPIQQTAALFRISQFIHLRQFNSLCLIACINRISQGSPDLENSKVVSRRRYAARFSSATSVCSGEMALRFADGKR